MIDATLRDAAGRTFWIFLATLMLTELFLLRDSMLYKAIQLSSMFISALIALTWVHFDSKAISVKVGALLRIGVVAAAIVFVPVYLFRSHGWRAGSNSILWFAVKVVGTALAVAILGVILDATGIHAWSV